ncbi:MAG: DUF87 domain-containing protein [Blastocatellia bacterium]
MTDYEKLGVFYLGRPVDLQTGESPDTPLLYDSKDLTTHAVCIGMTGSGKTGLCIGLLEEAAIDGIPAIVIDPKGDIGNLLLQFPDMRPSDFRPWINEDDARTAGISPDDFAKQQAEFWAKGIADWGQDGERIRRMQAAAEFAIYTPGSSAGTPVNILGSFAAPPEAMREDEDLFRDQISSTVTALLGLLGRDADPVKSRDHILLSTIFADAWTNGRGVDAAGLILAVQKPPFEQIGVLGVDAFYPPDDRFELASAINSLFASPNFQPWLKGASLDIDRILYTESGKPRIAIFTIAHLDDAERMFFVSLLLGTVLAWTRAQRGTSSLRALVYMDEIFGYFPPSAEPPSKRPLLTLLKQARAFGVGIVLATQNPVDIDYKGLSNTGTWFIGRLQTERDKARVLEGLEGASATAGGGFDRGAMEQTLASLGKRVFLLHSVHESAPVTFKTRWTLSYLRGPLTRQEIRQLASAPSTEISAEPAASGVVSAAAAAAPPQATPATSTASAGVRPMVEPDVAEYFLPAAPSAAGVAYGPTVLACANVQFVDAKRKVDTMRTFTHVTPITDNPVPVDWHQARESDVSVADLERAPVEGASFAALPAVAGKGKSYAKWSKEYVTWLGANATLDLLCSPALGICSNVGESERDFRIRLSQVAREDRDGKVDKLRQKYAPKVAQLEERKRRAEQALQRQTEQSRASKLDTALSVGSAIFGSLFGSRGSMITKAGSASRSFSRASRESSDVDRANADLAAVGEQMAELESALQSDIVQLTAVAEAAAEQLETVVVKPKKTNIAVQLVALAWEPAS